MTSDCIGFVSLCEARAKSDLVWSVKALRAEEMSAVPSIQRLPMKELVKQLRSHERRLSDRAKADLSAVEEIAEAAQVLRHRIIHGVWGENGNDVPLLLDMKLHRGFEYDQLEHALIANSELARRTHQFLMSVGQLIASGKISVAPREPAGMSMRLDDVLVSF